MIGRILHIDLEKKHGIVYTREDAPRILTIYFNEGQQNIEKNSIVEFERKTAETNRTIYAKCLNLANEEKTEAYTELEKQLYEKKLKYEGSIQKGKVVYLNPEGNDGIVDTGNNELETLTIYFQKSAEKIAEGSIVEFEIVKAKRSGNIYAKFTSCKKVVSREDNAQQKDISATEAPVLISRGNNAQQKAIFTTEGPVLITAGPGTGKTFTLVQRTIYLIEKKKVKPESILIATFTEKAAKELITRISNELEKRNITVNVKEMYIGTFHSLCLRILNEKQEYTRLKHNYRQLDDFSQKYMIFQNINKFRALPGIELILPKFGAWSQVGAICKFVNNLTEELVLPEALLKDRNPAIVVVGKVLQLYRQLLNENNMLDFSSLQSETYQLFMNYPNVLQEYRDAISYIMVDEYQDTNYIQEQLILLLAGQKQNICVVGDDDQGLYRFRGATIRNILEFPRKFKKGVCKIIPLTINYRSNSDIVDFYNKWMQTTKTPSFGFEWEGYRYPKKIEAADQTKLSSPAVVRLGGNGSTETWHENILNFIKGLKESGKITDYNQIAFLFSSVKKPEVKDLSEYLEGNGINVYSPRSDMFFKRDEIRLTLGCLMLMFPNYVNGLETNAYKFIKTKDYNYFKGCIRFAKEQLNKAEDSDLLKELTNIGKAHIALKNTTDYAYTGLLYKIFQFQPFAEILNTDMDAGIIDVRPARNLAKLTQLIGKFEYLYGIEVLNRKTMDSNTEKLFNMYFRLILDGGIDEYEDDSEYAPSGCVSFLTIHQSKGMEFPIVIVGSLDNTPWGKDDALMLEIEKNYYHRQAFEPQNQKKNFDFWRLYYTAFSRPQDLLVLTSIENYGAPSECFKNLYNQLVSINDKNFHISDFDFNSVKNVNIKNVYSFTSHIAIYETCPRQYKFYKELEFTSVRNGAMLFGTLVHQTIEDIHKAVLKNEEDTITKVNITNWFKSNYETLIKTEHSYLAREQQEVALKQVLAYVERQKGNWKSIKEAEVDVSIVKPDYIIEGTVDLIKGDNDTIEIVDFKSEKKPDIDSMKNRMERYQKQLNIYAYMVEQRTGREVSKMHLYYTGEDKGNPMITFPYIKQDIDDTVAEFDDIVHKILRKDFKKGADDKKVCANCDFRYYCKNI